MDLCFSRLSDSTVTCLKLAQGQAVLCGDDQLTIERLTWALMSDTAVREAVAGAGGSQRYVALALDAAAHTSPQRELRPTPAVSQVIVHAASIARRCEHYQIEPGHVALALADDRTKPGYRSLVDVCNDVSEFRRRLRAALPTTEPSEEQILAAVARFPPLADREVQTLAHDLVAWKEAERRLDVSSHALPDDERRALDEYQRLGEALERLGRHHLHLAVAVARDCAAQGHRLGYAYALASRR